MIETPTDPGYYWARYLRTRPDGVANEWEPFQISVDTIGGYFCGSDVFSLTQEMEFHSRLDQPDR